MRGLDPRIHLRGKKFVRSSIDCRVKPGNDGVNLWTMGSTPATMIGVHAAFGSASLLSAKAQSSHSVSASTSARSTVEPHQMRKPGGASR